MYDKTLTVEEIPHTLIYIYLILNKYLKNLLFLPGINQIMIINK